MSEMSLRVGIDVGGTFTDLFVVDADGKGKIYKTPSRPDDPGAGVLDGLAKAANDRGVSLEELLGRISTIVHGTTIATNATLTGRGAKTGFITTRGFRDVLNMRRGLKLRQYDAKHSPPPPLVPRNRVAPVTERVNVEGEAVTALVEDDVREAARLFREEGVEAIGVSYLWSFLNPGHEQRTAEILREEMPEAYISLSSETLPQIRVYERNSTTVLNAYVGPILQEYLEGLQKHLADRGFAGTLLIVQSNGGVMSPEVASRFAVNTLLSGPAAGPVAGLHYGGTHGYKDITTIDMGGTSFDVALVANRTPVVTNEAEIGGYRVALPTLDIHTVGAGGGSIAWVDAGGILRVGPESAGAQPGPACYGNGGTRPTVTDADVLLGYLDPTYFSGGEIALDIEAARRAAEEHVAEPLGLDWIRAADGIYRVVNATMAAAVNDVSVGRGYDPREFALVVAGGAGPIHAAALAHELGIGTIIVPRESSVFCAVGTLLSDLKHDYVRTFAGDLDGADLSRLSDLFDRMRDEATATLRDEGIEDDRMEMNFSVDLRMVGQFTEVEVPVSIDGSVDDETVEVMTQAFHERHETLYGFALPGTPLELINLRLTALGRTDRPALEELPAGGPDAAHAKKGSREAYFEGEFQQVPVYDGLALQRDNRLSGPAIVEQPTTTVIVTPGYDLTCDAYGNYVIQPTDSSRA
jgi:N-methylhydantoinase A